MRATAAEAFIVFQEEFRRYIRRRVWIVLTLAVPVILGLLVVATPLIKDFAETREGAKREGIGYADLSGKLPVADAQEKYPQLARYRDRPAGEAALMAGEIKDFFAVPPDYLESGKVEWLYAGPGRAPRQGASDLFRSFLQETLAADVEERDLAARFLRPAAFDRVRIGATAPASPAEEVGGFFLAFVFAMLLLFSLLFSGSALLQSVSEEKENRMIEVLVTSVSPLALMAGKMLALGTAGLIQISVWVASIVLLGPRITGQIPDIGELPVNPGLLAAVLLFFVFGYLLYAIALAGVGAAATSVREATQISFLVTIPVLLPIYLTVFIVQNPDGGLVTALSFIPFTAPTTMMLRMAASEVPLVQTAGSLLATFVASLAALWVSARVFRAGLLMYGQRMTLRGVWRALRQAR